MVRELICGTAAYGLSRAEVVDLLGPADTAENSGASESLNDESLVYRVVRSRGFTKYEPPVPKGYHRVVNAYDVRVVFDPVNGQVIWCDVLPALEPDG